MSIVQKVYVIVQKRAAGLQQHPSASPLSDVALVDQEVKRAAEEHRVILLTTLLVQHCDGLAKGPRWPCRRCTSA